MIGYTNEQGIKKSKFSKIIKTVVIVTAALALIEVIVIFYINHRKNNTTAQVKTTEKTVVQAAKSDEANHAVNTDSSAYANTSYGTSQPAEPTPAQPEAAASGYSSAYTTASYNAEPAKPEVTAAPVTNDAAKSEPAPVSKPAPVSAAYTATTETTVSKPPVTPTANPAVKPVIKQLSQQKMGQILNDIRLAKTRLNSFANCVTIRQTANSNVSNAFKMASFLHAKGYVISGRETVGGNQKGVKINATGSCIQLTIGSI